MTKFHQYMFIFVLLSMPLWAQGQADSTKNDKPKRLTQQGAFDPEKVFFTFQEVEDFRLDKVGEWMEQNLKGAVYKKVQETKPDELGYVLHSYQQEHQGIEVEDARITIHAKNGRITAINGKRPQTPLPGNVSASITEDAAKNLVLQHVAAKSYMKTDYPVALLIAKDNEQNYRLAYKIRIDAIEPFEMKKYFIDAQTGEVFKALTLIAHANTPATATTKYNGVQTITTDSDNGTYRLRENGARHIHTFDGSHSTFTQGVGFTNAPDFTDSDNIWTNTLQSFAITAADQSWWYDAILDPVPDFYIIIVDGNSNAVYTSDPQMDTNVPVTFGNINLALSNPPYSVFIVDKELIGNDQIAGLFAFSANTGIHGFSNSTCSATYFNSMAHPALDVHWGMEKTYDFYVDKFGRHSFDGNGSLIQNYVGVPVSGYPTAGLPNNAFAMSAPYNIMVYGNGDGQTMGPLVSLDVAGHEYSHLVINNNGHGGLEYERESGALNESFADIFGTAIEFYTKPNTANWTVGEQVMLQSPSYFRSLSNPNTSYTPQPKTYGDNYWINPLCVNPNNSNDYCGVHTNSGVQNFWFYLVSQGGSGTNYFLNTYNVTGVGVDKASRIAYRNLTNYLTNIYSSYAQACEGSLSAAQELYGNPSAEYSAVFNAWYAVGVLDAPIDFTVSAGSAPYKNILSWTYNSYASPIEYYIERKTGTNGIFSQIGTTNGTTTFEDDNIQPNTQYCYRVRAFYSNITLSLYSEVKCITTPSQPPAPTNLNATTINNNSIGITWTDNANNESGYILEYSMGGNAYTVWDTFPANITGYIHTGLPSNAHFFYKVRTLAYNFVSAYSNIDDAYTQSAGTNKQITKLEYYIDTDPSFNNGVNVPITAATFLDKNFTVALTNVSDGLHTLYVRVKDNVGKWSQIYSRSFVKLAGSAGNITVNKMEYYIDADPGFGSGIDVPVTASASINQNFNVNLSAATNGLHTLYVRARDNQGKWSQIYSRSFVKLAGAGGVVTVNKLEYYIDADPGFGSGTDVSVTASASINQNFNVNLSAVTNGLHTLYVRARDNQGKWSQIYSRSFVKMAGAAGSLTVNKMEYYIDADPGFGSGIDVPVTASASINKNFNVDLSNISSGLHTLYVRARDNQGKWSQIYSRSFVSTQGNGSSPTITQLEYYWDTDPGFGNGLQMPVTPLASINVNGIVSTANLSLGNHILYIRAKDSRNLWSHIYSDTVKIQYVVADFTYSTSYLQVAFTNTTTYNGGTPTYSWNFGNGNTYIGANPPTQSYTSTCPYTVCLTAMLNGDTSTVCKTVTPYTPIVITANRNSICVGGSATFTNTLAGTPTPYTRQWQVSTDNITFTNISNATSSAYTATLNTAGTYYYRLAVIKSGQCTGYSNVQSVTVVPDPAVTITGAAAFCGSGSTTFTANPQYGAGNCSLQWQQYTNSAWSNIANGVNPTYTTSNLTASRNYRLRLSCTGNGCGIAYSNISTLTINPLPNVVTNAATAILCEGGQRGITASGANTYTWTPAAGLSATTGAIITAAPLVSTTYIVTGTNTTTGCVKSANAVFTVVTDPIVSINGATSMCLGASTNLTSVISGGTGTFTYLWQTSTNGTTWTSISGANLATYNLTATTTGIKYYRLKLTCTGTGCTAITYSNVLQITTNAMPTISLTGASPICVGGTAAMTAITTGGIGTATYLWQRSTDGGQTWTTLSSVNYPNYSPTNIQVNTSYKVTVSYTGIGCGSVTSNVFNIIVNPDPTISITGATALCGAGSTTFSATTTGGAGTCGVQWQEYVSGAWTNISGGTGNSFTTPTLTATRQYRAFVACSESGCGNAYSSAGLLTINALPNVTTNSPTTTGCVGVSKTITASGANSYVWSPSAGLNTTTGATVIATPTVSTTYTVTGTNTTTGCTNTATATITVIPDPTISISGPNSVTSGATATLTSTATGGTGTCVYQWQTSTNGTTWSSISGANSSTYTTPALTTAKYYRLTLTCNGTACNTATSNVLFISIVAIKQNDSKGDNSLTTIPESVLLAVENAELINIFPNPTQDLLNVELTQLTQGTEISLRLFDATGKLVETYKAVAISDSYTTQLHLRKLAIGLYSLEVRIGDTVNTYKVAKE